MVKTQDKIWDEIHAKGPKEWKERREASRNSLLRILAPSCTVWEEMTSAQREELTEEQKNLLNDYFRLRDRLAPRFIGREEVYCDDGVNSKEEFKVLLGKFESIIEDIQSRANVAEMGVDERESWAEEEADFRIEINRAREKLRLLSRLQKDDPRIAELLYLYKEWDELAKMRRESYEKSRMGWWGLLFSILADPKAIEHEKSIFQDVIDAEGIRNGVMMALWAFDYAPENIKHISENGDFIPLPHLGRRFLQKNENI